VTSFTGRVRHKEDARRWYDRGVACLAEHAHPYAAELAVSRADAEAVLGIEKQAQPAAGRAPPEPKE
jgi:hypothetical protein